MASGRTHNITTNVPSYVKIRNSSGGNFAWTPPVEKMQWARSNPQNAVNSSSAFNARLHAPADVPVQREKPQSVAEDHSGGPPAWKGTLRSSNGDPGTSAVARRLVVLVCCFYFLLERLLCWLSQVSKEFPCLRTVRMFVNETDGATQCNWLQQAEVPKTWLRLGASSFQPSLPCSYVFW